VNAVLKKHFNLGASTDANASSPRLADAVFVICRWRDGVARLEDMSEYVMVSLSLLSATTDARVLQRWLIQSVN
jgi:hypothetical protein